jgi:hypothetical protein
MTYPSMSSPFDSRVSPYRESHEEGPMFDRDRFLASDHEARLRAEAEARRVSALARSVRPMSRRRTVADMRASVGRWLVAAGSRLAPEPETCEPARPRTA